MTPIEPYALSASSGTFCPFERATAVEHLREHLALERRPDVHAHHRRQRHRKARCRLGDRSSRRSAG